MDQWTRAEKGRCLGILEADDKRCQGIKCTPACDLTHLHLICPMLRALWPFRPRPLPPRERLLRALASGRLHARCFHPDTDLWLHDGPLCTEDDLRLRVRITDLDESTWLELHAEVLAFVDGGAPAWAGEAEACLTITKFGQALQFRSPVRIELRWLDAPSP